MVRSAQASGEAPGLYVHVPFCVSKCRYCGFFSEVDRGDRGDRDGWVASVLKEATFYRDRFGTFDTLYLGGGTPSILSDGQLASLLGGLRSSLSLDAATEVTIELNPGDVTESRAARWLELGISRASLGVQSFDDETLSFLGRRHDAACALDALAVLRRAGFENIGIDLIWGIPGRSPQRETRSLDQALSLSPEHLSCYELTVEKSTPLHRDVLAGRVIPLHSDRSADAAMAYWQRLDEAGYEHYEVSNFARTPSHRSRHNTKYWRHVPYLGLGPSAHSFDGLSRWANIRSVHGYRDRVRRGQHPVQQQETLSPGQVRLERVALGMRTAEGVARAGVEQRNLQMLLASELVVLEGDRVRPTARGMLVADALADALTGERG